MESWGHVLESPYMIIEGRHGICHGSSIVLVASVGRLQRIWLGWFQRGQFIFLRVSWKLPGVWGFWFWARLCLWLSRVWSARRLILSCIVVSICRQPWPPSMCPQSGWVTAQELEGRSFWGMDKIMVCIPWLEKMGICWWLNIWLCCGWIWPWGGVLAISGVVLCRRCRGKFQVLGCSIPFLHWFVDDRLRRELYCIVGVLQVLWWMLRWIGVHGLTWLFHVVQTIWRCGWKKVGLFLLHSQFWCKGWELPPY